MTGARGPEAASTSPATTRLVPDGLLCPRPVPTLPKLGLYRLKPYIVSSDCSGALRNGVPWRSDRPGRRAAPLEDTTG